MTADPLAAVLERMRRAVSADDPATATLYGWLAYHLGWAEADGTPASARTAKGLRPQLCLLACRAVGGEAEWAVPAAAAIELTHEFSLIHDDIEDGDRVRRGRPTLWSVAGLEQAVNAGDCLWAIARRQLSAADLPESRRADIERRYDIACVRLAEGQFLDLLFESQDRVDEADYVAMVARKTGALFGAAAGLGACCGGGGTAMADAMTAFGEALGIAFQMQDDILGTWGDEQRTGKAVGADLARRKKTLPVVLAWSDPAVGPALRVLYAGTSPDPGEARELAAELARAGYDRRAAAVAHRWQSAALAALDVASLDAAARAELDALARSAVARQR